MARLLVCAVLAALASTGCGARSRSVRGPDNEDAHLISCAATSDCYDEAAKICAGQYVLHSTQAATGHRVEILVSCRADLSPSAEAASASEESGREDGRVCQAASRFRQDFGAYWVSSTGGAPLDEPPAVRDFILTCQSMPEPVQRCMHDKYRSAHKQACAALLVRLDLASKTKIDALYLLPDEPAPRTPTPGGSTSI